MDVQDVKATVDLLVKEGKGEYGPGKQFVTGGSHGGFLSAHRECDYPFFSSMLSLSDHSQRVGAGHE